MRHTVLTGSPAGATCSCCCCTILPRGPLLSGCCSACSLLTSGQLQVCLIAALSLGRPLRLSCCVARWCWRACLLLGLSLQLQQLHHQATPVAESTHKTALHLEWPATVPQMFDTVVSIAGLGRATSRDDAQHACILHWCSLSLWCKTVSCQAFAVVYAPGCVLGCLKRP